MAKSNQKLLDYVRICGVQNPIELPVVVQPAAKTNSVVIDAAGLRVKLTVPPIDGRANAAIVKLLSQQLGVAKSRVVIVRGLTSRRKLIKVWL